MTANILKFLLIEIIFNEVFGSYPSQRQKYIQVPSQQYYQLSGAASTGSTHSYGSPSAAYQSIITPTLIDYSAYTKPRPYTTAVEKTSTHDTSVAVPELPPVPTPLPQSTGNIKNLPPITSPPFDTNVLNNLAIALQLLIVSNLLNMPVPESSEKTILAAQKFKADEAVLSVNPISALCESASRLHTYPSAAVPSKPQTQEYQAYFESNLNDQPVSPQYLPNSNFLGSDNMLGGLFGSFGVPPAKARPGLNLKSPYDAIASAPDNTPPSPFEYRKADFQSPYSAILAADNYKDLFSMDFY